MLLPLILLAAQVPVMPGKVATVTWDASNCGLNPCGYYVSRLIVPKGTLKCPAKGYTPLNQNDPVTDTNFPDRTAGGLTVCYEMQTESDGIVTPPSAPVGPVVVP